MVYYLGHEGDAPLVPWNEAAPSFYTTEVEADLLKDIAAKLPRRRLIYVGSRQGCGCGFRTDADLDPEEAADTDRDHQALAAYLEEFLRLPAALPPLLFAVWSGDEGKAIQFRRECTPAEIRSESFRFRERELITLKAVELSLCGAKSS